MRILLLFCVFFLAAPVQAAELRAIALNIEAGWKPDAELASITAQMQRYPAIDLWALSEVTAGWEVEPGRGGRHRPWCCLYAGAGHQNHRPPGFVNQHRSF